MDRIDPTVENVKNRAWRFLADTDEAFERGDITEDQWHQRMIDHFTPVYLAADNPRSQSGSSSNDEQWEANKRPIADAAIDRDGTFLDVGCASGYLMECVHKWAAENGYSVEPYGLDISPGMASLAQRRLPKWTERIWIGNANGWIPSRTFTYVRTGLEYVPKPLRNKLIGHLLEHTVEPGGKLIIGVYSEEIDKPAAEEEVTSWGYRIDGRYEVAHRDPRLARRLFWITKDKKSGGKEAIESK